MPSRKDIEALELIEAQARAKRENKLKSFAPYPKQKDHIALGATRRERLLMAGNRCGKSEAGAYEMACHLTGIYPPWWQGRKFTGPIVGWAVGQTGEVVRDVSQLKLLGQIGLLEGRGTGMIPKANILKTTASHSAGDAVDVAMIRHISGGVSTLSFKAYSQGAERFQGAQVDVLWADEEPPLEIYNECYARVAATGGIIYLTFTPLLGLSDVVNKFLTERSPDRAVTVMTIDDAKHIPESERASIIAGYAPHEREARAKGVPMLGSGRVFQTPESEFLIAPFEIPEHYALLWSMDYGVSHPFAATLLAWDRENDTIYVAYCVRMADSMILDHAEAMKSYDRKWGEKIPVAWPGDTNQRREFEGRLEPIAKIYKSHGLRMLSSPAAFPDGSNSTEAGIALMAERLRTKKLRVFNTCQDWVEEYRTYHRKDGQLVKVRDDLMSATRVGVMTIRSAQPVKLRARQAAQNPNGGGFFPGAILSGDDLF